MSGHSVHCTNISIIIIVSCSEAWAEAANSTGISRISSFTDKSVLQTYISEKNIQLFFFTFILFSKLNYIMS